MISVVIASGTGNGFGWAVFYKLSNTFICCYQNTTVCDTCYTQNDRFSYPGYNKQGGYSSAIKGDSTIDDIVVSLVGLSIMLQQILVREILYILEFGNGILVTTIPITGNHMRQM